MRNTPFVLPTDCVHAALGCHIQCMARAPCGIQVTHPPCSSKCARLPLGRCAQCSNRVFFFLLKERDTDRLNLVATKICSSRRPTTKKKTCNIADRSSVVLSRGLTHADGRRRSPYSRHHKRVSIVTGNSLQKLAILPIDRRTYANGRRRSPYSRYHGHVSVVNWLCIFFFQIQQRPTTAPLFFRPKAAVGQYCAQHSKSCTCSTFQTPLMHHLNAAHDSRPFFLLQKKNMLHLLQT
jgi:hypothetical protein